MGLGGQGFCDSSLRNKKRDDGGWGSKIVQNSVTSFMDDPLANFQQKWQFYWVLHLLVLHLPVTWCWLLSRYIKVKVEHYLLFKFSPPKISCVVSGIKYICFHLLQVFYVIQPSSKQIICFDFRKQNSVLPIVFYVPWWLCKENLEPM